MNRCRYCMEEIDDKVMTCPKCGKRLDELSSDPRYLKPGVMLQGKYEVGAVLGAGGFGITYVGWDTTLERKIAIKEYYPRLCSRRDDDGNTVTASAMNATDRFNAGLDRFLQEAKSLRELNGVAGVVKVDNFFRENGTGYIVMEFLEGKDLRTMLKESTERVDYEWCRRIILTILDTLSKIHEKGILHRDIAPDNVLVTNEGVIKLIDFGAARHEEGVEVENTDSLVKSGYSPLEQYSSTIAQGPYTDLYATAALMYYMLTGEKPPSAIERRDGVKLIAPSDKGISIPEKAEMGMMMCLNIMPEHRLESAKDFMETLDGADFTPDYEPTWNLVPEKKKGLKSTKVKVEILIAVLLLLVLGGVGISYFASDNGLFSLGGSGSTLRIPAGIVNQMPEDAIKAIRQEGIENTIKINYKYDPASNADGVTEVFPNEGDRAEDKEIELTISSSHIAKLELSDKEDREGLINGYDYTDVQSILKKSGISSDVEEVSDGSIAYGQVNSIDGIDLAPRNLVSGDNVVVVDENSLVEVVGSEKAKIKYSIGAKEDYAITNEELKSTSDGLSGSYSKKKIEEEIADNIIKVISERKHMEGRKSFGSNKETLKKTIVSRISIKKSSSYSSAVDKGKVISVKCKSLNLFPENKKKFKITVEFSLGKKPVEKPKKTTQTNNNGSKKKKTSTDDWGDNIVDAPVDGW